MISEQRNAAVGDVRELPTDLLEALAIGGSPVVFGGTSIV